MTSTANGLTPSVKPEKPLSPRVVLAGKTGRILCVADIRGDYHELNRLIRVHDATAVIHTGDFGFINSESLERMNDKILRHLLEHSPLIPAATRAQLLAIPASAGRNALINALNASSLHFPLSQFPHLLDGAVTFPVPVFTNWGLIEDFRVLEKFRTGEYEVKNLTVIDEATSGVIEVGGVKLRLFGLGGSVSHAKLFDHGEGHATIAGGQGVMWTTALQIGELLETAQRTFDPSETRLFVASSPVGRNGLLSLLSNALKADLTISGGLHFRYSSSFNDFAVHTDFAAYRAKLLQARDEFLRVYNTVKDRVDSSLNDAQQGLLKQALSLAQAIPQTVEESSWANTWNWGLSDASCGHMTLSITDGRVTAETKSRGLNFAHRSQPTAAPVAAYQASVNAPNPRAPHPDTKPVGVQPRGFGQAVPSKPGPQVATQPPIGPAGVKGILSRPLGQQPQGKQPPTGPATPNNSVPSSIPARPPTQPRQPRGAPTPQGASSKDKLEKSSETLTKPANAKPSTPQGQANGKPATPVPGKEKEKSKPASNKKELNGGKDEPRKDGEREKKERPKKEDKAEKEPIVASTDDKAEGNVDEDGEGATAGKETPEPKPRKPSLYLKGIPAPTSEEEIKSLFPNADKITAVKIIMDHVTKKQKDFAYVDFEADVDMQEALKGAKDVIRETTFSISVSNPPPRAPFGTRGRGGPRRGGRIASGPMDRKKE